jgi:mono/diheme cytochrome c family protein
MKWTRTILIGGVVTASLTFLAFQTGSFDLEASIARGRDVYNPQCITCHMENGEGVEGVFPPLAKSDYLMADKKRSIEQTLYGVSGEIKVNGKMYTGDMPAIELTDVEASDVLNFIRNSWGNKGEAITPEHVKEAARKK